MPTTKPDTGMAHTAGPWMLCAHLRDHDQCSCGYRGGIWSGDGEVMVCEMGGPIGGLGDEMIPRAAREVQFADARLIAAAPDMLEALHSAEIKLARYMTTHGPNSAEPLRGTYSGGLRAEYEASLKTIRAAIAKAEGRS